MKLIDRTMPIKTIVIICLINFFLILLCSSKDLLSCYSQHDNRLGYTHEDICYIVYSEPNKKKNFNNSRKFCQKKVNPNSDLVKIPNNEVNSLIYENRGESTNLWVGLQLEDWEGWKWVGDGTKLEVEQENWTFPEPNGDGNCVEMWNFDEGGWNDISCSSKKNFVCSYNLNNLFDCYGVIATNSSTVCSGNGECVSNNRCSCSKCFEGDKCTRNMCCYGKLSNETGVCSGKGSCVDTACLCQSEYHGGKCEEKVLNARLDYKNHNHIKIDYEISVSLLNDDFKGVFDCIDIMLNDETELGKYNHCMFIFDDEDINSTILLSVKLGDNPTMKAGDKIKIRPVTSENEVIELVIKRERSAVETLVGDIVLIVMAPLSIIVVVTSVIFVITLVCCCVIVRKNRKKKYSIKEVEKREVIQQFANLEINKSLFQIDYNELKIVKHIGNGGYGKVYLAQWKKNLVAFKLFDTKNMMDIEHDFEPVEREISILASLSHPNILIFYGATLKPPRVGIITEFCENGNIRSYINTYRDTIKLEVKLAMIVGVIDGMEFLHSKSIIHRDLKPDNVLLSKDLIVKIIDFGISRLDNCEKKTSGVGTSLFMAPEVIKGRNYDPKCDVFSFGIMIFQILSNNFVSPYGNVSLHGVQFKIANNPSFRPNLDEIELDESYKWLKTLVSTCWDDNPEVRPDFSKISLMFEPKEE